MTLAEPTCPSRPRAAVPSLSGATAATYPATIMDATEPPMRRCPPTSSACGAPCAARDEPTDSQRGRRNRLDERRRRLHPTWWWSSRLTLGVGRRPALAATLAARRELVSGANAGVLQRRPAPSGATLAP